MSRWTKFRDSTVGKIGKVAAFAAAPVTLLANAPKSVLKEARKITGADKRDEEQRKKEDSYLDRVIQEEKNQYNPYLQRGQQAYQSVNPIFESMVKDPTGYYQNQLGGYQSSPQYKMMLNESLNALGGTQGTPSTMASQIGLQSSLMGPQMQNWLQNVYGVQRGGLAGQMGLYDKGFQSAQNIGSDLANVMGTKGSLEFQRGRDAQQMKSDILNSIMQGGASLAGLLGPNNNSGSSIAPDQAPSRLSFNPSPYSYPSRLNLR